MSPWTTRLACIAALTGCSPCADSLWYTDADQDGWGDERWRTTSCEPLGTRVLQTGDCRDNDATMHPDALERCDGQDNDCDGEVDDDTVPSPGYPDADQDGFGDAEATVTGCQPRLQFVLDATDCDDADDTTYPGAPARCDGTVNDCGATQLDPEEVDHDGDGFVACAVDGGWDGESFLLGGDCDDDDPTAFPGAPEACDGALTDCNRISLPPEERDEDGDGAILCEPEGWRAGAAPLGGDCDDHAEWVSPAEAEICDGVRNRCGGGVPREELDGDGDGFVACTLVGPWRGLPVRGGDDCDDADGTTWPGGWERCDGVANSCGPLPVAEVDQDGDRFVRCALDGGGWDGATAVDGGGDCDDNDALAAPGRVEVCDERDNDCDGTIDDGLAAKLWFTDGDGDGAGDSRRSRLSCAAPAGAVEVAGDCDDSDGAIPPGCVADLPGPWTQSRVDAANSAYFPGWFGSTPPVLSWTADFADAPNPPVAANGRVFVASGHQFRAFDVATGDVLWTVATGGSRGVSEPALAGAQAIVCSLDTRQDELLAFDAATGASRWTAPISADHYLPVVGPTVTTSAIVYAGGTNGGIVAFEVDGNDLFATPEPFSSNTEDLTVWAGEVFSWRRSVLRAYDASSGGLLATTPLQADSLVSSSGTIAASDDRLYLIDGSLVRSVSLSGEPLWAVQGPTAVLSTPAVSPSLVAVSVSFARTTLVFEKATGRLITTLPSAGDVVVLDDVVLVSSEETDTTAVYSIGAWTRITTLPYGGQVAVAEGGLFITSEDQHRLAAYSFP